MTSARRVGRRETRPRITVLLATHNGARYLRQQVESILQQDGVDVQIVISDDDSRDGTPQLIDELAADARVAVLPPARWGSARANFLRLIREAPVEGAAAVAFADQDDIWDADRLRKQLRQLDRVDAVSANVIADFGDRRLLIDKAQPQRSLDFVMESAGPGCTFVLSPAAFTVVREVVRRDPEAHRTPIHDWLIYAVVRAAGMRWHIDPAPVLDYRQHETNDTGANIGLRQARRRLRRLRSGDFRRQAAVIARIAARVSADAGRVAQSDQLASVAALLESDRAAARWRLLRGVGSLRRKPSERVALAALLVLNLW